MAILTAILNTLMVLICLFLICLILIQRGKGGGLAGAFGGVGGSSAFGTKAGDIFTRVTVVVASVWIVVSLFLVVLYNQGRDSAWVDDPSSALSRELTPKSTGTSGTSTVPIPPVASPPPAGTLPSAPAAVPPASPEPSPVPAIPSAPPTGAAK